MILRKEVFDKITGEIMDAIAKIGKALGEVVHSNTKVMIELDGVKKQLAALGQAHGIHAQAIDGLKKAHVAHAGKMASAVAANSAITEQAVKAVTAPRTKKFSNLKKGKDGRVDLNSVRVVEE